MKNNIKKILLVSITVIVGLSIFGINNKNQVNNLPSIGIILPLSGDFSSIGNGARMGALMAFDNLVTKNINLVFEDDGADPKKTVSAFMKLITDKNVKVIICMISTPCSSISPLADKYKIPILAMASASVQKGHAYVFRFEISTIQEGIVLANFINSKNYRSIASIVENQEGVQSAHLSLLNNLTKKDVIIITEAVNPNTNDYRSNISKILNKKPDLIVIGLLTKSAGAFAKQSRQMGYQGDFVGFNFIESEETLTAAQGNLDGIIYTQATKATNNFIDSFKIKYNINPGPGAPHLHDIIAILNNIFEDKAVTKSSEGIVSQLRSISDFSGALGNYKSITGNEFSIPVTLKTIKNNTFVDYN